MRKVLMLALLVGWIVSQANAQICPTGSITLSSQQEIDDFASTYPDCTLLQGNLTIEENVAGDITNLAGLSQLVEIGGYLYINGTSNLTSLTGLENLTSIYNSLLLYYNTSLVDLTGLESLTTVGLDIRLLSNPAMTSLSGLNALTIIGRDIDLNNNENLSSLSAWQNLTSIGGGLRIMNASALQNLTGLENLTSIGGDLDLTGNTSLESIAELQALTQLGGNLTIGSSPLASLAGLENLTAIPGALELTHLTALETLDPLAGVTSIGGGLVLNEVDQMVRLFTNSALESLGGILNLNNNDLLVNLEGLENLNSVGSLSLGSNPALVNMAGLEGLTTIENLFTIVGNDNLQSLTGLNNLTTVGGRFLIFQSHALTDLEGLSSLSEIGHDFEIRDSDGLLSLSGTQLSSIAGHIVIDKNSNLLNLNGLEGITVINDRVEISSNGALVSVDGLNNLSSIATNFVIEANNDLADLSALSNLNSTGYFLIYGNDDLVSLNGLEGLVTVTNTLEILGNNSLTSLSGLDNLTTIGENLKVWNHPFLLSLTGLGALETIEGYCSILSNQNLESLTGLESLSSVGNYLEIRNFSLEDLTALSNLTSVGNSFRLNGNPSLTSLAGTENIDFTDAAYIAITDNTLLSVCGQENICDYIVTGGTVNLSGNAEGCNEIEDLLQTCFADTPHTSLVGRLVADTDLNCAETNGETGIANWLIEVSSTDFNYAVSTDNQGYYWLPVLQGDYTLNAVSPSPFWTPCFVDSLLQVSTLGDSITTDFFMQPQGDCPYIDWNVVVPPLRVCQTRTITIDYCNNGAQPAEDVIFMVTLDSTLTIDTASIAYTIDADGVLFFELPPLALFECGQFTVDVFLACEGVEIGDFPCVNVALLSDELCAPDPFWDGSLITASGYCENDSIYFELENIGTGNMSTSAQLRVEIVIDDIILMLEVDEYQLPAGATQVLQYAVQGQGLRIEADQTPGHPVYTEVSAVVANCTTMMNGDLLTMLPMNDGDPFSGTFCAPAINSYDPNIKTAIPAGVGPDHLIDKDWQLDYTIQFQNTGNDVAYEVVIADTLSEQLDLSTLDVKGASHPFTWALTPERSLIFTFADILLPDSTTNEPGSHGFVQFSINPKADILPGNTIENTAHIYFDFNDAIVTNTVVHTIRKPVVATSERTEWCAGDLYGDLLISQDTSLQLLTSYLEYDSIHFVHLSVLPSFTEEVSLEVPYGEYFQDVLITGDTSVLVAYTAQNGCDSLVTYTIDVLTNLDSPTLFADIEVYPNPVRSLLRVEHQQNGHSQTWTLSNGMGQMLWQRQLSPNQELQPIDMYPYPAGLYNLQVKTAHGTLSWKVIRE